ATIEDFREQQMLARFALEFEIGQEMMGPIGHRIVKQDTVWDCIEHRKTPTPDLMDLQAAYKWRPSSTISRMQLSCLQIHMAANAYGSARRRAFGRRARAHHRFSCRAMRLAMRMFIVS